MKRGVMDTDGSPAFHSGALPRSTGRGAGFFALPADSAALFALTVSPEFF